MADDSSNGGDNKNDKLDDFFGNDSDERDTDLYRNPAYYTNPILKAYLTLSYASYAIVCGNDYFNCFMLIVIGFSGILVGVDTYPSLNNHNSDIMNYTILAIFTIEIILKICMEGIRPYRYFTGNCNI